eukprot:gene15440-18313_t
MSSPIQKSNLAVSGGNSAAATIWIFNCVDSSCTTT